MGVPVQQNLDNRTTTQHFKTDNKKRRRGFSQNYRKSSPLFKTIIVLRKNNIHVGIDK